MNIAIIILNWNGRRLLEQFLPSVVNCSSNATIYLADNASTDDSVSYVAKNFPTIHLLQNQTNGGYASGYNEALKNLQEDLFVLMNNDVEVTENWLGPIISAFEANTKLEAAQPKILDYKNKAYFEYAGAAGGFIDSLGYPYCRGRIFDSLEKDEGKYDEPASIFWASGACLIIRSDAFKKSGGFDEDFFAHQEEVDLCWRLQAAGGVISCIGDSKVYHLGGGTLQSTNPMKTFYNFRNSLLMLVKNVQGTKVWLLIIIRLFMDGLAGLWFLTNGKYSHTQAILMAHFSFYKLLPRFLKKRKKYASPLRYFTIKSAVWRYFILKKRNFNDGF